MTTYYAVWFLIEVRSVWKKNTIVASMIILMTIFGWMPTRLVFSEVVRILCWCCHWLTVLQKQHSWGLHRQSPPLQINNEATFSGPNWTVRLWTTCLLWATTLKEESFKEWYFKWLKYDDLQILLSTFFF